MPMAQNTTMNCSSDEMIFACRAICSAMSLCGRPEAEKIGSFWPRTSVVQQSMADIPVWMNSSGISRL